MSRWSDEIETLDSSVDFERIVYLLSSYEFAWDIEKALEFALFRTYAVPSISGLLARTGAFQTTTRKRYDDTELLLSEISENGQDSERGRAAITRINEMHSHYRISNDDMLYVLTTFVVEPVKWLERFGRRPMTRKERCAWGRVPLGAELYHSHRTSLISLVFSIRICADLLRLEYADLSIFNNGLVFL